MNRNKRIVAALCAVSMLAGTFAVPDALNAVRAGQILGETSFDYKMLPWHTCESRPAKQDFELTEDGNLHIKILKAEGAEGEKWDLQLRHRNLNFRAGYTYEINFKVKAKREGMELCSQISNIKGDEVYCILNCDKMQNGPHMGGKWGKAMSLTTDWTEVTGTFTPTKDLEACEWSFHYSNGTNYEGNAVDGDELWFDDMSIISMQDNVIIDDPFRNYYTCRDYSGLENGYISVNQVGYFPGYEKIAVFGDDAGNIVSEFSDIKISEPVEFEVVNAKTGDAAYTGESSAPVKDADSGDTICKLDFSELDKQGTYYIRINDKKKDKTYRSFEFDIRGDLYSEKDDNLFTNAMNYFYQNRSGIDIEEKYITSGDSSRLAHKGGHMTDTAHVQKIWKNYYASNKEAEETYSSSVITATGGWYEAGDHTKSMISGGTAAWTLQNMYERTYMGYDDIDFNSFVDDGSAVNIPEAGNKVPDILDEAAYELDWMAKMKVDADDPEWGEKAAGLYYDEITDNKWTGIAIRPWDYEQEWKTVRIVKPPTFAATLNFAACAAQASRLWAPYDNAKSEKYLEEAVEAYKAYKAAYYEADLTEEEHPEYGGICAAEELREDSLYEPVYQEDRSRSYGDTDVSDEAYLAACEIFVSAKSAEKDYADEYLKELESYKGAYQVTSRLNGKNSGGSLISWDCTGKASLGTLTLALHRDLISEENAKKIDDSVIRTAQDFMNAEKKQGYGLPYEYDGVPYSSPKDYDSHIFVKGYERDSNGAVLNNAIIMAYAYDITGERYYKNGMISAMNYLLGTNPLSFSYISGYGSYCLHNPHHRYWSWEVEKTLPETPSGVISGGPNAGLQDPYVRALGFVPGKEENSSQRCYADSVEAWSVNEPSLDMNASLAWVVSFLQEECSSYDPDHDIRRTATPAPTTDVTASPEPTAANSTDPTPTSEPAIISEDTRGDINCDGKIDVTDLSALAIALVDREELKGQANKNADIDKDGEVTLADLARLRQYLSKKTDKL